MFDKNILLDTVPRLTIGALSKGTGCNIETIRYYERIKLFPEPVRTEGGHRMYGTGHLKRLGFIRRARELGFTVEEIRALLRLVDGHDQPCAEVREVAAKHLSDVRTKIAALRAMERVLKEMVVSCGTGTTPDCPLLEALFEDRRDVAC
jgi:MerR family mercuric resistance operon transcriptional regulator